MSPLFPRKKQGGAAFGSERRRRFSYTPYPEKAVPPFRTPIYLERKEQVRTASVIFFTRGTSQFFFLRVSRDACIRHSLNQSVACTLRHFFLHLILSRVPYDVAFFFNIFFLRSHQNLFLTPLVACTLRLFSRFNPFFGVLFVVTWFIFYRRPHYLNPLVKSPFLGFVFFGPFFGPFFFSRFGPDFFPFYLCVHLGLDISFQMAEMH